MLLPRAGLARQITLATASLAFISVLAAGSMAYVGLRSMVRDQVAHSLQYGVQQVSTEVQDRLNDVWNSLNALAANTLIGNALIDDVGRKTYLPAFLRGFRSVGELPVTVYVTDFNGKPFATNGVDDDASLDAEWVAEVVRSGKSDAMLWPGSDHAHLLLAAPIIFPNTGLPEGALVYSVHPDGWFETYPVLRNRESLPWLSGIVLQILDTRDGTREEAAVGRIDSNSLVVDGEFRGPGPMEPVRINVRLLADEAMLRAPGDRLILLSSVVGVGILLIAVVLSRVIGERLASRLQRLQASVAEVISHEDARMRFAADGHDEAAQLAGAFNRMLERLDTAYRELDERRRAELDQSEARFRSVLEQAGDAIYLIDANSGRILDGNGKAHESLGYTREELLALRGAELYAGGVPMFDELTRRLDADSTITVESEMRRKGGDSFPVEVNAGLITVGEQRFLLAVARDISERKRSEKVIRERALIVSQMSDALIVTDLGGRISDWNPGAERIFGYPATAILGQDLSVILNGRDAPQGRVRDFLAQAVRHSQWSGEVVFRCRDGSSGTCEAMLVPLKDESEQIVAIIGVYRDVTEKKLMEQELLQAQKMEAVGQLTGGIAHDFNNLLQIIFGNLQLANRGLDDGDSRLRSYVDTAYRAGERAAELTRQLLAFSRKQRLYPKPVEPNALLSGILSLLQRTLGERIVVRTELADDVPAIVVDHNALESAVLNLAVNSKAAMPDGGELTLTTRAVDPRGGAPGNGRAAGRPQGVEITIRDTGVGMTPEVLQRAFEPFFTTKHASEGTGLGLSTVYGFVTQSRGQITLESEPGQGTLVRMVFPASKGPCNPAAAAEATSALESTGGTILVVEDEPVVRDTVLTMVQACGYNALEASNAESALRMLKERPEIDLLLTDIVLAEGMNGFELAGAVQEMRRNLPVLLCSGYSEGELARTPAVSSAYRLLRKPYTVQQLAEALRVLLDA